MIGIIGAMSIEVEELKAIMDNVSIDTISGIDFYNGKINNTEVVVAVAGVGKVNAAVTAQTMILKYDVDALVNIGVAGGLEPSLKIGDIVIADRVVEHDMDTTPLGDAPGFITGLDKIYMHCDKKLIDAFHGATDELGIHTIIGTIASGDQFISTQEQRKKIVDIFNGAAAEMEGASIGHVCTMNNIPFCVLRAISDGANDDSHMDFPTFCKMAVKNSIEIIKLVLSRV